MKRLFWMACAWSCVGVTTPDDSRLRLEPTSLEIPLQFGPLSYRGTPDTFGDPALGRGYRFNGPGMALTFYAYDSGTSDIPDGADNIPVCEEFEHAKSDVMQAGYSHTVHKGDQLVRLSPPEDHPLAREAAFEFELENHPALSFLWFTAAEKNFIKVRFTADAQLRDDVPELRRAVLDALGEAIGPGSAPAKGTTENNSIDIAFGDTGKDEMTTGFLYAGILGAIAEKTPQAGPVCGGEFVPDFPTELSVYRALVSMRDSQDRRRLLDRLAAIEEAGFLHEFLWMDAHRDEWGTTPPEGLDVGDYQAWRKKKLKKFKLPRFARLVVHHPRPLPVDAADR
jgi:hypothetical protein